MLICPNCGKEYPDEVAFCSACGTKVVPVQEPEPVEVAPANAIQPAEMPFIVVLLSFIGNVVQIVSAFFAAVALATPYIYVKVRSSYSSVYATTTYNPGTGCSVFALLFAMGGVALAVVSFIFAMKNGADLKTKFNKITSLASAGLLFILSIVLLAQ